jgi:hypothetical protein
VGSVASAGVETIARNSSAVLIAVPSGAADAGIAKLQAERSIITQRMMESVLRIINYLFR